MSNNNEIIFFKQNYPGMILFVSGNIKGFHTILFIYEYIYIHIIFYG